MESKEAREWHKYKNQYTVDRITDIVNRKILHREIKKEITRSGKKFLDQAQMTSLIDTAVNSKQNIMISRYGSTEATLMFYALGKECGAINHVKDKYFQALIDLSGFFPNDIAMLDKWLECMKKASDQIDLLGFWNTGYQEYLVDKSCSDTVKITDLSNFQPYHAKDDRVWTASLEGKKVLVIHPFAETIKEQYEKREKIWENPYILPQFTLKTVKAVQTIAGQKDARFSNWFEALDYMTQETLKEDFDIAIIACGAYGMPLAANLKKAGKLAFHWGGISQIWFGIKGARWDNNPNINQYYNEEWVRPSNKEKPKENKKVEGGCYW